MDYLDLFKTDIDYHDWDRYLKSLEGIDGLTPLEKERGTSALLFLRSELGEDFLRQAFQTRHPLIQMFYNFAPWTRKWLIWFADSLKIAKSWENYPGLLTRIKNSEKYAEGGSVLEVGYKLNQAGFRITVDPTITIAKGKKIPDLSASNEETQECFYVEVSDLKQSFDEREASETMQKMCEPFYMTPGYQYYYAGKVLKILAPRHLEELLSKVKLLIQKCQEEEGFHDLLIPGELDVAVSATPDNPHFSRWLQSKGLQVGEFHGPPIEANEIHRTKRKLGSEQKQLPPESANLIVLRNSRLFSFGSNFGELIRRLEDEVFKYPHLLMTVITGGYQGSCEPVILTEGEHCFMQKTETDFCVGQYLLLLNRFCDHKVSMNTISKMKKAFWAY